MRYKRLGPSGLRVSELCLGTMTFGTAWGWGGDLDACRAMFDAFVEAGGNFIDTANKYTDGESERIVGELIGPDRDRFVVGTKYTLATRDDDLNAAGNHKKNLRRAVESSEPSPPRLSTTSASVVARSTSRCVSTKMTCAPRCAWAS